MLELSANRKNKVNLQDYNYQKDIECRMQIADFSFFDHEVLQEIFFSSLKLSKMKLARNLGCEESSLFDLLERLTKTKLLSVDGDTILVDKEMRKYFEFHTMRFNVDFKLNMDYLQGILRKIPIHFLPTWYAIPRTSNNIFESIMEKYLFTPQIFQRYLVELSFSNPITERIIEDLFASKEYRISSSDIISKYNLKREEFEEIILLLEFSFVCCLTYTKGDGMWTEWVTPFHEWHEYLNFFRTTECQSITKAVTRQSEKDFAFVDDLAELLEQITEGKETLSHKLLEKAELISLIEKKGAYFSILKGGEEFMEMSDKERALHLYRHPLNHIPGFQTSEKKVREAEKSIKRVLHKGWVFFDDFVKGTVACINEKSSICLQKVGKSWKYALPSYNEEDHQLLRVTILEWLVEAGITAVGTCEGRDCFMVTDFGRYFFEE